MATKKKTPKSTRRRSIRRVTPQRNTPANAINQGSIVQQLQSASDTDPLVTPTNIAPQNTAIPPTQTAREPTSPLRVAVIAALIGALPALGSVFLNIPGYLNDVAINNTSRAVATANAATLAAPVIQLPSSLPKGTTTPTIFYTTNPAFTVSPTSTTTLEPEYIEIRRFLDELSLLTERAIYEGDWELITNYYCGEQSNKKLENFENWIKTFGTNAVGRRLIENRSLEIISNPIFGIDWKVSQVEIWLFSGDAQQLILKYTYKYNYYLNDISPNSYCLVDYDVDLISQETLPK